jgi:hypothetical protein
MRVPSNLDAAESAGQNFVRGAFPTVAGAKDSYSTITVSNSASVARTSDRSGRSAAWR